VCNVCCIYISEPSSIGIVYFDSRNLPVTASLPQSPQLLDEVVSAYLGMKKDTAERAAALLETDSCCPLAQCMQGYLNMHACRPEQASLAGENLARARYLTTSLAVTPREALHVAALGSWCDGDLVRAIDCWEEVVAQFPLDILALRLAQFMTSYLGKSLAIRDSVARVLPAWHEGIPGYGFVLSCYAYGLEEAGDYEMAERFGHRALAMNPNDLWGAHAVTHVMEMQGRADEGIQWMTSTSSNWKECGNFVNHLWWHGALFYLAAGKVCEALELYDRRVKADGSHEYLDIANASALLWRIEQAGQDVGNRWQELSQRATAHLDEHFFVFVDLHYLVAAAANSGAPRARELLSSCSRYAERTDCTQAQVMRDVGLAIAKAVVAHRNRSYAEAADLLFPVRNQIYRIGGSHAQRDLFEQMLIDSAIRADQLGLAHSLLREKLAKRRRDLWAWRTAISVAEKLHDEAGVAAARLAVANILKGSTANKS
jgi:tetratricopeptide (TPR) repeat protein